MKTRELTLADIGLVASTRGMLGAGVGLLLSGKLSHEQRKAVGWTLFLVGVVTTIPLVLKFLDSESQLKVERSHEPSPSSVV